MDAGRGGHSRTAITIAQALKVRGHDVSFAIGRSAYGGVITDAGFDTVHVDYGGPNSLRRHIQALLMSEGLDAIHSFSIRGLAEAQLTGSRFGIPCLYTRCGGPPHGLFTILSIIRPPQVASLSAELAPVLAKSAGLKIEDIAVLPARVNLRALAELAETSGVEIQAFRSKYGIPDDSEVILRIARIAPEYMASIVHTARATAELLKQGRRVKFVHIGVSTDPELEEHLMDTLREINERSGEEVAISARDEAKHAIRYVPMAKIVIGAGRSAMEAMAMGKPTMVVSPNGFSGLAEAETVDELAYYNFSGRNLTEPMTPQQSIESIVRVLRKLLTDHAHYADVAAFSQSYAFSVLDSDASARIYETMYQEFDVTQYSSSMRLHAAALARRAYDIAVARLPRQVLDRMRVWIHRRHILE